MSNPATASNTPALRLEHRYADDLPELALSWRAEEAPEPRLLTLNEPLADELGLDLDWLRSESGLRFLVGNAVPEGANPVAQAYAGHQFGSYSPRLGDGRALLLGELSDPEGRWRDLHLKGSGRTPFARGGDGLAAVGPMLREHLVSESMHALGVPTTRALAVLATGRPVRREGLQPGALLVRVATSHLRVGTFQYARATGDADLLRRLADHAIARHYPTAADAERPYLDLFEAVVAAQAALVARWMQIGFVHGVLNTDNVTVSGETIDYGPCAFLDAYDPAAVFSSIDQGGRYAFGQQPAVTQWNLARLAEALLGLFDPDEQASIDLAVAALGGFGDRYTAAWSAGMRKKLGLPANLPGDVVAPLLEELLALLSANRVDFTSFFRQLAVAACGDTEPARALVHDVAGFDAWCERWLAFSPDADAMRAANPVCVPRNHLVEEALTAAREDDLGPTHRLLDVLATPFTERAGWERYAEPAPESFGPYRTFCGT